MSQLKSASNHWADFIIRHENLFVAISFGVGLVIRWYWCGQDLSRFLNPFAPLFA